MSWLFKNNLHYYTASYSLKLSYIPKIWSSAVERISSGISNESQLSLPAFSDFGASSAMIEVVTKAMVDKTDLTGRLNCWTCLAVLWWHTPYVWCMGEGQLKIHDYAYMILSSAVTIVYSYSMCTCNHAIIWITLASTSCKSFTTRL